MSERIELLSYALLIGTGATAATDIWALVQKQLLGQTPPNYGLVGRWLAYLLRGRFHHDPITASSPVRGERWIGWIAHYLIGIAFAAMLLLICGLEWARQPALAPALLFGIGTVAAPFLLMQPGVGAGIASSRTPRPTVARIRSLANHAIFGLGLYVTAFAVQVLNIR